MYGRDEKDKRLSVPLSGKVDKYQFRVCGKIDGPTLFVPFRKVRVRWQFVLLPVLGYL